MTLARLAAEEPRHDLGAEERERARGVLVRQVAVDEAADEVVASRRRQMALNLGAHRRR